MSEAGALEARIDALRRDGAPRLDAARWRVVEALVRRLPAQPEGVQAILRGRLERAVADVAQRVASIQQSLAAQAERLAAARPRLAREARRLQAAGDGPGLRRLALQADAGTTCAPLASLNERLRAARPPARDGDLDDELASVRRFRLAWGSSRTDEQVRQAIARRPAKPGPLNSHALVLESLAMMGELSPAYLRHFVAHVESLQWLDGAAAQVVQQAPKPAPPRKAAAAPRAKRSRK